MIALTDYLAGHLEPAERERIDLAEPAVDPGQLGEVDAGAAHGAARGLAEAAAASDPRPGAAAPWLAWLEDLLREGPAAAGLVTSVLVTAGLLIGADNIDFVMRYLAVAMALLGVAGLLRAVLLVRVRAVVDERALRLLSEAGLADGRHGPGCCRGEDEVD